MRKVKEFCNTKRKEVSIEEKNIIVMKDSFWRTFIFFHQNFFKNQVVLKKYVFWEENDPALSSSYSKKIS